MGFLWRLCRIALIIVWRTRTAVCLTHFSALSETAPADVPESLGYSYGRVTAIILNEAKGTHSN